MLDRERSLPPYRISLNATRVLDSLLNPAQNRHIAEDMP